MGLLAELDSVSDAELHALVWDAGSLDLYLHSSEAGQLEAWVAIQAWAWQDTASETRGQYARIFVLAISRRWGKTALCLWWLAWLAWYLPPLIGRPVRLRYTSALQISIDTIVGEVLDDVFRHAPAHRRPTYYGKRGPLPPGLYFPNGSRIAMAGLDKNPKALRGQGSDGDVVSEAAFVTDLEETISAVLYSQYQGRPWARMLLESSAPDRLHTAWETVFVPDAQLRAAYFTATIEHNPMLLDSEREEFIRAAGGRDSARCRREYFNEIVPDEQTQTFPEARAHHVYATRDEWQAPQHRLTITAQDPGFRDLYALLFATYDHALGALVIEDCWTRSNASTEHAAAVIAAREYDLWGTWPAHEMQRIPLHDMLDSSGRVVQLGWTSLLAGDRCARHAEELHRLAQIDTAQRPTSPETWPFPHYRELHDYDGAVTYWDTSSGRYEVGPTNRVSDVKPELEHDLRTLYGLGFEATTKEQLRTMVWLVRTWLSEGRIRFLPRAQLAYDHVRACSWNERRDRFDRHEGGYGHYDIAAALVYLVRRANERFQTINPVPPKRVLVGPDVAPAADSGEHDEHEGMW